MEDYKESNLVYILLIVLILIAVVSSYYYITEKDIEFINTICRNIKINIFYFPNGKTYLPPYSAEFFINCTELVKIYNAENLVRNRQVLLDTYYQYVSGEVLKKGM